MISSEDLRKMVERWKLRAEPPLGADDSEFGYAAAAQAIANDLEALDKPVSQSQIEAVDVVIEWLNKEPRAGSRTVSDIYNNLIPRLRRLEPSAQSLTMMLDHNDIELLVKKAHKLWDKESQGIYNAPFSLGHYIGKVVADAAATHARDYVLANPSEFGLQKVS